jgi:hypothetical protein
MIAYAAVTSLSSQAQVSDAAFTGLLPGIIVLTPADPALPNQKTDLSVKPPQPTFQDTRQPLKALAIKPSKRSPESGKPKVMTVLSISCYEQPRALLMRCRTDGNTSNAAVDGRIVMKGVVTEDVVSAGKILIAAGSKVAGIGYVDPDSGRVESKGNWSIIADHREVRVHAEVQDADTGFHGIQAKETSFESEPSQRQAVMRNGRYCFLPDKTPFVLSIRGEVNITVLQPLESPE